MSLYVGDRLACRFGWNCNSIQTCRCRINTIDSPDDEHRGCSKHVENYNKYIRKKNCASSCLFTRTEPRCTVNKT